MPIPTDRLVETASIMGARARRVRVTRDEARTHILGFAHAWSAAHRDESLPPKTAVEQALRAYAQARRARFSAQPQLRIPRLFAQIQ